MRLFALLIGLFVSQFLGVARAESENLAKDLFPKSKLVWEKVFADKIVDIQRGGENIVVVERRDDVQHTVSYMDANGNTLWQKTFEIERGKYGEYINWLENISISDDGKYVIVNCKLPWERILVRSYDIKGNLIWESGVMEPGLTISPQGSYAITTRLSGEEAMGHFRVFDNQTGKEIWNDHPERIDSWFATFLNDTEIVYAKNISYDPKPTRGVLMLFDAKARSIVWKINLQEEVKNESIAGVIGGSREVETSNDGKLIAVSGIIHYKDRRRHAVLMFNNKGNLLWYRDNFVTSPSGYGGIERISFSLNSKELYVKSYNTIDVLDALTGERKKRFSRDTFGHWNEYVFISEYLIVAPRIIHVLNKEIDRYGKRYPQVFDFETEKLLEISEECKDIALIIPMDKEEKYFVVLSRNLRTLQIIKLFE